MLKLCFILPNNAVVLCGIDWTPAIPWNNFLCNLLEIGSAGSFCRIFKTNLEKKIQKNLEEKKKEKNPEEKKKNKKNPKGKKSRPSWIPQYLPQDRRVQYALVFRSVN